MLNGLAGSGFASIAWPDAGHAAPATSKNKTAGILRTRLLRLVNDIQA